MKQYIVDAFTNTPFAGYIGCYIGDCSESLIRAKKRGVVSNDRKEV